MGCDWHKIVAANTFNRGPLEQTMVLGIIMKGKKSIRLCHMTTSFKIFRHLKDLQFDLKPTLVASSKYSSQKLKIVSSGDSC